MTRDAWVLLVLAVFGPFIGVAWFTGVARWSVMLGGGVPTPALQIVGLVVGLLWTAVCFVAASRTNRSGG
jgi:hypothetical protein